MKRTLLHALVVAAASLALAACGSKEPASASGSASAAPSGSAAPHEAPAHELARLTVDEVEARIAKADGKTFVFDDNHAEMYAAGHVPGAKLLGIHDISPASFPADKEATLIFYCSNEL